MKKKFFSLLLAMLMTAGTITSCADSATTEEDVATADTEEAQRVSMTLSMWLPTSKNTTEEAIQQVSDELNKLTQAKFDTAIELHLIPEDEYWDTVYKKSIEIGERIEAEEEAEKQRKKELKALKAQGIKVEETETETEAETEEETIINELGISIKQYPEVGENQMDIFLVQGYENYLDMIDNDYIQQLDQELNSTSKILKQYIYPTYFDLANQFGIYAVPNNHPVGEYEYLLINKELVDEYDYHFDELTTFIKCGDFIKDIGNQNLEGVVPLLAPVEAAFMEYWGMEEGEWSLVASQLSNATTYSSKASPRSILANTTYTNTVLLMKELEEMGYVGDGTLEDGEKFAVGIVKGDPSTLAEYEDEYYSRIYKAPMFTEDDVFGSMFAVSTYSKSLERSMEIVTFLNTNKQFRTILQYGVQGIHWDYEDDSEETIEILSDDYQMDLLETGNVYMTYPGEGRSMDEWEIGKQKNIDAMCDPYIGFTGHVIDENEAQMKELEELSKIYKEKIDNCSAADFKDAINEWKNELKEEEAFVALTDALNNENSIPAVYLSWYDQTYPSAS